MANSFRMIVQYLAATGVKTVADIADEEDSDQENDYEEGEEDQDDDVLVIEEDLEDELGDEDENRLEFEEAEGAYGGLCGDVLGIMESYGHPDED